MRTSLATLLLALVVLARPAWSEEPQTAEPPPIDAAEVGRLLLSSDEGERDRGVSLLLLRIGRGGDLAPFLAVMAKALAEEAQDEQRLVARWVKQAVEGTPEEQARARRLLAAMGPSASRALLRALRAQAQEAPAGPTVPPPAAPPSAEATRAPPAAAAPTEPPAPARVPGPAAAATRAESERKEPAPPPVVVTRTTVVLVPEAEVAQWLVARVADEHARPGAPDELRTRLAGGAVAAVTGERAGQLLAALAALPDVRVLGNPKAKRAPSRSRSDDGAEVLLEGGEVRYRRDVRRTPKGAWAVETDALPRGLEVQLRTDAVTPESYRVTVETRYVEVPERLPTSRVRPAPDVEPVELDTPEWRASRAEATVDLPVSGGRVVAAFPGVMPEHVVVVDLWTRAPPAAKLARPK